MNLNENSIVYSGGVGEDISFDILLQSKYNCNIMLIDPTLKSIKHFDEVKQYYNSKQSFTGGIQNDYYSCIQSSQPNFDKFQYINIGLWNKKDELKFYKQNNDNYVSQSLVENMFGQKYDIVPVNSIKNIMEQYGHTQIDLLKLDIEGAEIETVNQMLDDKIYPTYILIEFDLLLKNKDYNNATKQLIQRISAIEGYKMLKNDQLNITFVKV
jgi:FkbM family methyltransferase